MLSFVSARVIGTLTHQPKTSKQIQGITGYSDVEIREAVREARLKGFAVCSGARGFWLWDGKDESWSHTKNNIRSRAMALLELYNAMDKRPLEGQIELFKEDVI